MSEWQPIESAPRGRPVLVFSPANNRAFIALFNPDGTSWVETENDMRLERTGTFSSGGGWFQPDEVTHWMPLPEPPDSHPTLPEQLPEAGITIGEEG